MFPCGSFREAVRTRGDGWRWSHHAQGVKSYDDRDQAAMHDRIITDLFVRSTGHPAHRGHVFGGQPQ